MATGYRKLVTPPNLTDCQRYHYLAEVRQNLLARRGMRRQVVRRVKQLVFMAGLSDEQRESLLDWLRRNEKSAGRSR